MDMKVLFKRFWRGKEIFKTIPITDLTQEIIENSITAQANTTNSVSLKYSPYSLIVIRN
jgi:hypothetical protein